jgi:hypothetical protein
LELQGGSGGDCRAASSGSEGIGVLDV